MFTKGFKRSLEDKKKQSQTLERQHMEKLKRLQMCLQTLLKEKGPLPYVEAAKGLGLSKCQALAWLREIVPSDPETFKAVRIKIGKSTPSRIVKSPSWTLFDGLSVKHMGPIIYLKDDERIVEFVGSKIMKAKTEGEAKALSYRLNRIFGKKLARKMIEFTGYRFWEA